MKLNWRQIILYIAALGIEGCWLYALLMLVVMKVVGGNLSVLGILLLYPVAFLFNWFVRPLRWPRAGLWSISWLAWAVSMLLMIKVQVFGHLPFSDPTWLLSIPHSIAQVVYSFRPELLILISASVLWWRGQHLAYSSVNFVALVSKFQFGLLILAFTFLIAPPLEVTLNGQLSITLVFFLFALLGISVAHALEGTSWLSGLNQGRWGGLLLFSISLILILGLLISVVITPDLLQFIVDVAKWVWGFIARAFAFIINLIPTPEPASTEILPKEFVPPPQQLSELDIDWSKFLGMEESTRRGLRIGWNVLIVSILLLTLWRISSAIFLWLNRKLTGISGAEFESLHGAFRADLLSLLKRILSWPLRLKLPLRKHEKAGVALPEATSVRQIYRQLLRWAAAGGHPRPLSQTPYEYCYALSSLLPEARSDLDLITQQYVLTRYGARLPTEGELDQLSQAWHKVKQNNLKRITSNLFKE